MLSGAGVCRVPAPIYAPPMAGGVKVHITDAQIIRALNTRGGAVFTWSERRADQVRDWARDNSPVNDPLNAAHRGGAVGIFQASWATLHQVHGHHVTFAVLNAADHAPYVEFGRGESFKRQSFSWTETQGRRITVHHTKARPGQHVLREAVNAIGVGTGDWGPLP